jgi:hypothetical protein
MGKPTSRLQMLAEMEHERHELEAMLRPLSEADIVQPAVVGPWSIKDVVAHLTGWHELWLGWYRRGRDGEQPALPAEGFSWRQLPQLNEQIYERYRDQAWGETERAFQATYAELHQVLVALSDDDLCTPGKYKWTGKKALIDYVAPNTSEHYRWAQREIRKGRRARAKPR